MRLPQEGRERNRGFDLGVSSNYVAEDVLASEARHQLFYWHLKKLTGDIWWKAYRQRYHVVGDNMRTLSSSLPFCASYAYKESLVLDLPSDLRAQVPATFYEEHLWELLLFDAKHIFGSMAQRWTSTKATKLEMRGLDHLSSASFWATCLTEQQCQARLLKDMRKSDSTTQFRTSQELCNDLDVAAFARPEGLAVFHFWQHLMLDCSTVSIESHNDCTICLPFMHMLNKKSSMQYRAFPPTWKSSVLPFG